MLFIGAVDEKDIVSKRRVIQIFNTNTTLIRNS